MRICEICGQKMGAFEALGVHGKMEQHALTASDPGRILGQRELGSKILRGDRELSKTHIRELADYFHVNAGMFV